MEEGERESTTFIPENLLLRDQGSGAPPVC